MKQRGHFVLKKFYYFVSKKVYWDKLVVVSGQEMTKRKNTLKSTAELTLKQKAFVDIYVSNWGEITKVEAAKRAGYKSNKPEGPTEIASRLTDPNKNPHVVRYMEMKYNQELKKHEGDKLKKYKRFET